MASQVPVQLLAACMSTKGSLNVESNLNFYTERSTRLIYEATFFDEFVLVRPASPMFYQEIRQLSWPEFTAEFEEFFGDRTYLRSVIDGDDQEPEPENVELL